MVTTKRTNPKQKHTIRIHKQPREFVKEKALDYFQRAIKLSNHPGAFSSYADFLLKLSKEAENDLERQNLLDKADAMYKKACEQDAGAQDFAKYAKFLYKFRSQFDEALKFFREAENQDTHNPFILQAISIFFDHYGDDEKKAVYKARAKRCRFMCLNLLSGGILHDYSTPNDSPFSPVSPFPSFPFPSPL